MLNKICEWKSNKNHRSSTSVAWDSLNLLLDILDNDPDRLRAEVTDLGDHPGVFLLDPLRDLGVSSDQVEDDGQAGQQLGGAVAGHLGHVLRPAPALEVAGGEEGGGGEVAGGHGAAPHLAQAEVEEGAGEADNTPPLPAQDLTEVVKEQHCSVPPQLPPERLDGLLLDPGEVRLVVNVPGEGEQELGGGGAVLLSLGGQAEADEGQQLHLLLLHLSLADDEVKVSNSQMESNVAEGKILLYLKNESLQNLITYSSFIPEPANPQ